MEATVVFFESVIVTSRCVTVRGHEWDCTLAVFSLGIDIGAYSRRTEVNLGHSPVHASDMLPSLDPCACDDILNNALRAVVVSRALELRIPAVSV